MKPTILLLLSILFINIGCNNTECNCVSEYKLVPLNDSIINSMLTQEDDWFHTYWERYEEPILQDQSHESYRLAITVLLADYYKVYRIENKNRKYNLNIKEYAVSATIDSREDSLVNDYTKELSKSEWNELTRSIKENCFWTLPVDIVEDDGWLDGSSWTLEGYDEENKCSESNYHFLYRHSPYETNDTSNFIKICEKFLELDPLVIKEY